MRQLRSAMLLPTLMMFAGCDSGRIDRLKRENQELKAQIERGIVSQKLEAQAKCSKDSRTWFSENWSRDKDTVLLDFSNHYNAQNNKCFILVEHHYNSHLADAGGSSWTNDMILTDVYENAKYASFTESHVTNFKPTIHVRDEVIDCDVQGDKCKSQEEFNKLLNPYMTN